MRKAILTAVTTAAILACAHQDLNAVAGVAEGKEFLSLRQLDEETRKRLGATEPGDLIMVLRANQVILWGAEGVPFTEQAKSPVGKTYLYDVDVTVVKGSHCPYYRDSRGNKIYYHC